MNGDAATIAALLAVDPVGLGGVALRSAADYQRDEWLALLRRLLPPGTPVRRVPLNITDSALLGGLDLGATLQAGRPVAQKGLLAEADGGVVLLAMAERMSAGTAARLGAVLDTHEVALERDGLGSRNPARIGVVALDEGMADDEQMPAALLERLSLRLVLEADRSGDPSPDWTADEVASARRLLPRVRADDSVVQALCAAAAALGVDSMRASISAVQVARVAAALSGSEEVEEEHTALAARLVLAPRATRLPPPPPQEPDEDTEQDPPPPEQPPAEQPPPEPHDDPPPPAEDPEDPPPPDDEIDPLPPGALEDRVLEAAQAAIPPGLLASLKIAQAARARAPVAGRAGAAQKSQQRGRPIGVRRGEPRSGQRLNVIETLRAAAPWQKVRLRERLAASGELAADQTASATGGVKTRNQALPQSRIQVRKEDFHVSRFRQLGQTTTIFVVDASGSAALNRLSEAKGAVELLLADCYVRRDSVALLAFRGNKAEVLLPPTRSLARAKRSLSGLPGGGGTPLALGIDAARELADQIRRKGETPIVVLMTDGRGNMARDGKPGRTQAAQDATAAAKQFRLAGLTALLMDTSPQPHPVARDLAAAMGATYLPMPYAGAQVMSQAVRALGPR
jgi:magnesium chelatase subunit D